VTKSYKAFSGLSLCAKVVRGEHLLLRENLAETNPFKIRKFQVSIFAHSTSAVTPSEKSLVNRNRKSTRHFPMSLTLTV